MRLLPCGRDAVMVDLESLAAVHAVVADLRGALGTGALPAVVEIVPGARTVLVVAEPGRGAALAAVARRVGALDLEGLTDTDGAEAGAEAGERPTVELAVHYDGEDLDLVARDAGVDPAAVIALHTGARFTVAFGGFAPGFAYLAGLPEPLRQARLDRPRERIPAGAVGVAGEFGGVYPRASPGGWRLIGRLTADAPALFDPAREEPALLTPGVRVRFRDAAGDPS